MCSAADDPSMHDTPRTTADPWLRTDNGWSCNVPWHRLRQAQAEASAVPGALREALDFIADWAHDCIDADEDKFYGFADIESKARAALSREEATSGR